MDETGVGAEPARYRAFISYSHADSRFAGWLHRRLEGWTVAGEGRLAPIFLDRAELAAGPDLSTSVREALQDSAALVVVASPSARASRWVAQEIALFRELHAGRPILAALVEGEPGEAFPDALIANGESALEPLAADFRERRDGKRLGLLKIVAGLTGQPLDRLVQRDAMARQRRVMWITAAALLLSLILAALLVLALRARAEAQRQRNEAEGLVEFMLTDLRDKLKGTGSPTIMAAVNQRALTYYSQQDLDRLPDPSLDRRARVLHAMGEDNERLGNFPAAQKMYAEAWRITDEVLKRHPHDADAIFAHAQSEYWLGEAAWQQGDLETAGMHWRRYLAEAEALNKAEPRSKRVLMELGFANGNLCEWKAKQGQDLVRALSYCDDASALMSRAVSLDPSDKQSNMALANRIGWQADVNLKLNRFDRAIALRRSELGIMDRLLAADPLNVEFQVRRIWPDIGIGQSLVGKGDRKQGLALLEASLAKLESLSQKAPDNTLIIEQSFRASMIIANLSHTYEPRSSASHRAKCGDLLNRLRTRLPPQRFAKYRNLCEKL